MNINPYITLYFYNTKIKIPLIWASLKINLKIAFEQRKGLRGQRPEAMLSCGIIPHIPTLSDLYR